MKRQPANPSPTSAPSPLSAPTTASEDTLAPGRSSPVAPDPLAKAPRSAGRRQEAEAGSGQATPAETDRTESAPGGIAMSAAPKEPRRPSVDEEQRRRMIEEAAYRRYQQRGDAEGSDVDDWLEAEAEIDRILGSHPPTQTP